MTLTRLLSAFVARHWRAYAASAVMLASIALLTVWIPRQVGHLVDGLAQGRLQGPDLLMQLGLLLAAGLSIYLLRVGWRLQLFAAAYRLGRDLQAPADTFFALVRARFV